ncbi:MAG: T9SS type A sorting domain-containing protein, partial [Bacteroidia bacterium]|nr:T9SS type A sorting domain-containing protein [Bacteroidia bacterium]
TASVSSVSNTNINVYPNPAGDYFNIYTGNSTGTYTIVNLQGKIITQGNVEGETKVSTTNWAEGVYLVKTQVNGTQITTRVVITRQ